MRAIRRRGTARRLRGRDPARCRAAGRARSVGAAGRAALARRSARPARTTCCSGSNGSTSATTGTAWRRSPAPFRDALTALSHGNGQIADAHVRRAMLEAWTSPDLTRADRTRVCTELKRSLPGCAQPRTRARARPDDSRRCDGRRRAAGPARPGAAADPRRAARPGFLITEATMAKKAFCVGINDYPYDGSDLNGCVNDATGVGQRPQGALRLQGHHHLARQGRHEEADARRHQGAAQGRQGRRRARVHQLVAWVVQGRHRRRRGEVRRDPLSLRHRRQRHRRRRTAQPLRERAATTCGSR